MGEIVMGYYSQFEIGLVENNDASYPSLEWQLIWRIEDLERRLEELKAKNAQNRKEYYYLLDDIRYALPEHLSSIEEVELALQFAKDDLKDKFGIAILEDIIEENVSLEVNVPYRVFLLMQENSSIRNTRAVNLVDTSSESLFG